MSPAPEDQRSPLSQQEVSDFQKAIHSGGGDALRAALTLNGGAVLALMAFFAGKEVGPDLREALLWPLSIFAVGTAFVLASFAARYYADSSLLWQMLLRGDRYAGHGPLGWFAFLSSHLLGLSGGLAFFVGVGWVIYAFAGVTAR